jgi:hypothetical protein
VLFRLQRSVRRLPARPLSDTLPGPAKYPKEEKGLAVNRKCVNAAGTVGFALALFAGQSVAAFGEVAAQVWVERTQRITAAIDQPIAAGADLDESATNAGRYLNGIQEACSGLNGELIKNGGKNMPVWAQTAQQHLCLGSKQLWQAFDSGKKDKGYCRQLDSAAGYARKAKRGEDPDSVVVAAEQLAVAAEKLAATRITLVKKSIIGDSEITFQCSG